MSAGQGLREDLQRGKPVVCGTRSGIEAVGDGIEFSLRVDRQIGALGQVLAQEAVGVPETDKFQRVLELDAADFRFDPSYPNAASKRGEDFVLIEVLWSVGRSVKVKKKLLADLMSRLEAQGLNPEHVMLCFKETAWENWSFAGGRLIHA